MQRPVPWITQYASPSLIEGIAYRGHPLGRGPALAGNRRAGPGDVRGVVCTLVRDDVLPDGAAHPGRGGADFVRARRRLHGVRRGTHEPGRPRGLIYRPFAQYARDRHGLRADVITDLNTLRLMTELGQGRLVIASVHPGIRRPGNDPPGSGGHLVLVTGQADGLVTFHNPSGHTPEAVVATLPVSVFDRFAAHRGIALHL